jgi:hypothetical protein
MKNTLVKSLPVSASIHYEGAKEVLVPLPVVVACLVAIAAAILAARHLFG